MAKKRCTESQIISILREAEGDLALEVDDLRFIKGKKW